MACCSLVTEQQLGLLIGISTVLAVLMTLLAPSFEPGKGAFLTAGLVTGVTETSTGVGGPPLALVYQHRPAPVLRSTVAACFLIGEVISLVILAMSDNISPDQLRMAFLLLPAVVVGALLSRLVHHRLDGRTHALPGPGLRPGLRRRRHRPSAVTAADEARGTSTGTGTSTDSGASSPDITCCRSLTAAAAVSGRCRSIAVSGGSQVRARIPS